MKSQLFGLLAHPVSHSLSPVLYRQWFEECGTPNSKFELFDVLPEELGDFMQRVRDERGVGRNIPDAGHEIIGLAISIPHKEAVIQYLDEIDSVAVEIGAVNTIQCIDDVPISRQNFDYSLAAKSRKLKGWNTDWIGVQESFREANVNLRGKRVLILGAGGAARAVIYACMKNGADPVITNRTYKKAETLAADFRCGVIDWGDRELAAAEIVINATPLGFENSKSSPVAPEFFEKIFKVQPGDCVAFDLVYRPFMTKFLRDAASAGVQIITGDRMLFHQGRAQFNILTGTSNSKLSSQLTGRMKLKNLTRHEGNL